MTQLAPLQNPCVDIPSINQMHNLSSHSVISHYTHTYMQCYAYTGSYTHPLPIGYFVCVWFQPSSSSPSCSALSQSMDSSGPEPSV